MSTPVPCERNQSHTPRSRALGRLSRAAAALAAVICGVLASAATISAAFANPIPVGDGGTTHAAPVRATARVVTVGGMAAGRSP